jgi:hypothetical protein
MASQVTYDIRVYPLVKKFLAHQFDTKPFTVSPVDNYFSTYLFGCLDRYDHRDTQIPKKFTLMSDTLSIGIAQWRIKAFAGGTISPAKVCAFNDFVRQAFFEKLATEVVMKLYFGVGIKTAIQQFLDRYGITEDELPIEMAIRYYGRYRRKLVARELLEFCPVLPVSPTVILPHDGDHAYGQVEPRGRAVA